MNPVQKVILYFNTVKYLKWTQIWHRFTFRFCHPKPDLSPAPEISEKCHPEVAFPKMPDCYLGNNVFRFLNNQQTFSGWNDTKRDNLWLYNLHYFDWLRQPRISEEEGNRWIDKWIAENPAPIGNGWEPYTLSLRIVNWVKWHLSGHELNDKARHSLAIQVRFLTKRLEYHLLANHFLANAKALVFAGLFFDGTEARQWLKKGLEIYREQLPEQILADGGHFELSPMYHSIILEDLLDLKNILAPLELDDYIERMSYWLSVMTGPDGKIALFNDAAHGIALDPDIIHEYAAVLGFKRESVTGSADLPQSGYSRLQQGNVVCICDTGEIGPSYQPGHAHADALSFELWMKGKKILTNCGTGRYYNSPERIFQRSSLAHNTLFIDGGNSSEIWSSHRVARRGKVLQRFFSEKECSCSFRTWNGFICTRKWEFDKNDVLSVEDSVFGKGDHQLSLVFHPLDTQKHIILDTSFVQDSFCSTYSPEFGIFKKMPAIKASCIFVNQIKKKTFIREYQG